MRAMVVEAVFMGFVVMREVVLRWYREHGLGDVLIC